MSNFIGMVFGVLKERGIDTSDMSVEEAIEKFNELGEDSETVKNTNEQVSKGKLNDATEYYVSGDGMWINRYLKNPQGYEQEYGKLNSQDKKIIEELDIATDNEIGEKTLYRSVDASAVFGNIGWQEYDSMRQYLAYGESSFDKGSYSQNQLNNAKNIIKKVENNEIKEKGFISTTMDENVADNWGSFSGSEQPIVLEIKTNSKTKGIDLSDYDKKFDEEDAQKEVLLGRNQKYKISNITFKNGNIHIGCEMIDN